MHVCPPAAPVAITGPGAAPAGPPPQVAELERLGQQQGIASTILHLFSIALISLMVWKPGL